MTQPGGTVQGAFCAALAMLGLAGSVAAEPARYTLDPAHSWVQFEVVHFGTSTIRGRLGPVEGNVTLDRAARRGELGVTVPVASVSTGFPLFDAHLRGADLLDATANPTAWFVARQFEFDGDTLRSVRGEFTFRGVSRGLTLNAQRFVCSPHPMLKRELCGGDFEASLQRSDFGLNYGLPLVADRVVLKLQVEGLRQD